MKFFLELMILTLALGQFQGCDRNDPKGIEWRQEEQEIENDEMKQEELREKEQRTREVNVPSEAV